VKPDGHIILEGIRTAIPAAVVEIARVDQAAGSRADYSVQLALSGLRLALDVEWIANPSAAIIRQKAHQLGQPRGADPKRLLVLMAPYFTESQREWLRTAGVGFVDLQGNANLEAEGLYVSREGVGTAPRQPSGVSNPFSDKASRVSAQLIVSPHPVGVRELASLVDLTPGYVSKVLSSLQALGYVTRLSGQKVQLGDAKSLLSDWATAYDYRKNRTTGFFCKARGVEEILDRLRTTLPPAGCALTAQAGASLLTPYAVFDRVDLYAVDSAVVSALISGLQLTPVDRGANVFLWEPYYRQSALFRSREIAGLRVVSDIQLYLDLYKYPLRGREQADHLYEKTLKKLVERDG
jgi:hypothetical protein